MANFPLDQLLTQQPNGSRLPRTTCCWASSASKDGWSSAASLGSLSQCSATLTIRRCFSIPVLHDTFLPAQWAGAELIPQREPWVFCRLPSHLRDSHRARPLVGELGGGHSPEQHQPLGTTFWMPLLALRVHVTSTFPALTARSLSELQINLSLASISNNKQYQLRSLS